VEGVGGPRGRGRATGRGRDAGPGRGPRAAGDGAPATDAGPAGDADTAEDDPAKDAAPASIVVQRRIEWPDTDASGNYHNTAAFRFVEVAETALLERLGILHDIYGRHPRVHIEADFSRPLLFRDLVDIELRVVAVGTSSVTYEFEMRARGEVAVRGRVVAVLLSRPRGTPVPWPEEYRRLLLTAGPQPPELLVVGDQ
jgi:acyl-CoA thioesterase FadM